LFEHVQLPAHLTPVSLENFLLLLISIFFISVQRQFNSSMLSNLNLSLSNGGGAGSATTTVSASSGGEDVFDGDGESSAAARAASG
jgi:hypothetical protein